METESRRTVGVVVQTRMGSTRLPGKVMLPLAGAPVIDHVIQRLKLCTRLDRIVIATTDARQNDVIVERARANGVDWYRGSEDDVLARYFGAAREFGLDVIVRVTSDCPLIDPEIVDEVVTFFLSHAFPLVANVGDGPGERTFPRGLDVEVFSFRALDEAFGRAAEPYQREHVTPYIYEHADVHYMRHPVDYSRHRWTLDTEDDYRLIGEIYKRLYKGRHDFHMRDILKLMEEQPGLVALNAHVEQKKLKEAPQ